MDNQVGIRWNNMKGQDGQPKRREDSKHRVVLPCHSTRPPSKAADNAFAQVDGPLVCLPPLGTVLRQSPSEPPVRPSDPLVASLPVQRRLASDEVAELVDAYRRGVPVEELAASFQVNRTTVLGHVRRHGVPKRDRRALQGDEVDQAAQLYAGGQSADWVAAQLGVAASTVRRALKDAGVVLRPGGRRRTGHQMDMPQPIETVTHERVSTSRNEPKSVGLGASDLQTQPQIVPSTS